VGSLVVNVRRGEIWWAETPDERGRPWLILTRDVAIDVLTRVLAAPVTTRVRDIPTEVMLGPDDGLPTACAASFDNVRTLYKSLLVRRVGVIAPGRDHELCAAINAAIDC